MINWLNNVELDCKNSISDSSTNYNILNIKIKNVFKARLLRFLLLQRVQDYVIYCFAPNEEK